MSTTAITLSDAVAAVACLAPDPGGMSALGDDELVASSAIIAEARQHLDAYAGAVAAEIAHRSRRESGYAGPAQRQGFRTPEALLQRMTGSTRADAVALVNVGTMVAETAAADALLQLAEGASMRQPAGEPADSEPTSLPPSPWQEGVARAVTNGTLSFAQAEALRSGLGEPTEFVPGAVLSDAANLLIEAASDASAPVTADELRRLSRQLRDRFDADGLVEREKAQQDAQYIRTWRRSDGMVGGSLLLDAENGAYLNSVIDEITSPRRGGPRFVAESDKARAARLTDDPRSTERIAVESVIELLRIGATADPGTVYGTRKPSVRIIVAAESVIRPADEGTDRAEQHASVGGAVSSGSIGWGDADCCEGAGGGDRTARASTTYRTEGAEDVATARDPNGRRGSSRRGIIEGTGESVSLGTVERTLCGAGSVKITLDSVGRPLDVGREQRLFTRRQRIALAVRDGGCMWPDCDRPPSWTEAHHIDHWRDDDGQTNVADGILLCRYHHLLLHNNGWKIIRRSNDFSLRPPGTTSDEELLPLRTKSPLMRERYAG